MVLHARLCVKHEEGGHGRSGCRILTLRSCLTRTHVIQRNLRPPGGKDYVIPHGFGFDYITCANYTFEIWGWILFAAGVAASA